jgi:hypothetical protein
MLKIKERRNNSFLYFYALFDLFPYRTFTVDYDELISYYYWNSNYYNLSISLEQYIFLLQNIN